MVPSAAKKTAIWLAPLRPITLHKRPYRGVNVHVARRYAVPSQCAWCDLLNSEEMDGNTEVMSTMTGMNGVA